jgi:hypothetical protein
LVQELPRNAGLPTEAAAARQWQQGARTKLRQVVHATEYAVEATEAGSTAKDGMKAVFWKLRIGGAWTVPVVELAAGEVKGTAILVNDAGRKADPVNAERLLKAGYRVLAVDPFYFGESKIEQRDHLFAILVAAVGERPLGIQASQLAAVARWSAAAHKSDAVTLVAVGPRTSTIALVAAGLEPQAVGGLELHGAWGSLKEIIEKNRAVDQMPEMFCFGLLEAFDVKQLSALAAPRPVTFVEAGERAKKELAELKAWYTLLGREFDPVREGK